MKHYILISLEVPSRQHDKYREWLELSEKLKKSAAATQSIVVLGESAWMIPRNAAISFLAACVEGANTYEFAHRIWFLDEDQEV
jgi:hypothetical protein